MSKTSLSKIGSAPPATEADHRLLHASHYMTRQQSFAALHGRNEGLLDPDDMPDVPTEEQQIPAYQQAVQELLTRTGALASYRQAIIKDAFAAECPSWCFGDHELLSPGDPIGLGILHRRDLVRITFDGADTVSRGKTVTLSVQQWQHADGYNGPALLIPEDMVDELSQTDAAELGAAMVKAAELMAEIVGSDA